MELIKCAHCKKDINPSVAFCPFCGGRNIGIIKTGDASCPRCGAPLKKESADEMEPAADIVGAELDHCEVCGGLWLDRGEFHVLTTESNVYREVKVKEEYVRPPVESEIKYVGCVRCGKLMTRKNFGKVSGVIIDECDRHGVWLDGGELEKIRHFIADGGLERSQDREIEKNSQAIKDLATEVEGVAFTHKLIHFFNFKRWLFS